MPNNPYQKEYKKTSTSYAEFSGRKRRKSLDEVKVVKPKKSKIDDNACAVQGVIPAGETRSNRQKKNMVSQPNHLWESNSVTSTSFYAEIKLYLKSSGLMHSRGSTAPLFEADPEARCSNFFKPISLGLGSLDSVCPLELRAGSRNNKINFNWGKPPEVPSMFGSAEIDAADGPLTSTEIKHDKSGSVKKLDDPCSVSSLGKMDDADWSAFFPST